jgi:hypothetical protein
LNLIGGFRYLQLNEDASLNADSPTVPFFHRAVGADNTLLGGQVGLDYCLFDNGGPLQIDAIVKGGLFNNYISVEKVNFAVAHSATNQLAGVVDFQLLANWQILPHVSVIGGFYLLWVDEVALAPDQFLSSRPIDTAGVLLEGGTVGLSWTF